MKRRHASARRSRDGAAAGAALLLLVCLQPAPARAADATLADYRRRVHEALIAVDSLVHAGAEAGAEERPALAGVRRLLPKSERVRWGDGAASEVNNEWLHRALDEYEGGAPGVSAGARAHRLTGVAERLHALEARLAEAEAAADVRDKEAEKGRLASILRGPDYHERASRGGALGRLVERVVGWFRDIFPDMKPLRPGAGPAASGWVQLLVYGLALALVAYVARRYWVMRDARRKAPALREARFVLGEQIAPDRTASDLLADAEQLALGGDLRGAIRKAYVALLCELGDRRVVRLAEHKTNRDYLGAVKQSATPQLYEEMRPLTRDFERHWYGAEPATPGDWDDFRTRCRQALGLGKWDAGAGGAR